jgi:hypothetical protein
MQHDSNYPVAMYLQELASVEPLTTAEEAKLFRRLGARVKSGRAKLKTPRYLCGMPAPTR